MKHLVNVFYRLRRKPVFQHLLIHGQKHLRCEFVQFYGKRQIAPTCPSNEGLDKLVYGQDIRQVSGNDDDQGSN